MKISLIGAKSSTAAAATAKVVRFVWPLSACRWRRYCACTTESGRVLLHRLLPRLLIHRPKTTLEPWREGGAPVGLGSRSSSVSNRSLLLQEVMVVRLKKLTISHRLDRSDLVGGAVQGFQRESRFYLRASK